MKRRPKNIGKPRSYNVRDMLLTRKGGPMQDRRKLKGNRSLTTDELEEQVIEIDTNKEEFDDEA